MARKGRIFFSRFSLIPRTARRSSGAWNPPRLALSITIAFATRSEIPGRPDNPRSPARLISTSFPGRNPCRTVKGPPCPPIARRSSGTRGEPSRTVPGCGKDPGEGDACGDRRETPVAPIFHTRTIRDKRRIALGSLRLLSRDDPPGLPELVPDAVDQGLPGCFDDVVRDTDGSPLGFLVSRVYQDPYRGARPPRADDPHLVVEQLHFGGVGVRLLERLPDRVVHRVHRAVPERRRMLDRPVDLDHDGRLRNGRR